MAVVVAAAVAVYVAAAVAADVAVDVSAAVAEAYAVDDNDYDVHASFGMMDDLNDDSWLDVHGVDYCFGCEMVDDEA